MTQCDLPFAAPLASRHDPARAPGASARRASRAASAANAVPQGKLFPAAVPDERREADTMSSDDPGDCPAPVVGHAEEPHQAARPPVSVEDAGERKNTGLLAPSSGGRPRTLDEAIAFLGESGRAEPKLLKRLASDVRTATRRVFQAAQQGGPDAAALPCDPAKLRGCLARVLPARHRMTAKRWSSVKSSVAMVLKLTGWHAPDEELRALPAPAWREAASMIAIGPHRALVAGFGRFCARSGIPPAGVTESTLERYRTWRMEATLSLNVRHTVSSLRCVWNRAAAGTPGWPGRRLTPPPDPRTYALPLERLDAGFVADLNAYMARLASHRPLDASFNRKKAPLTLVDIRGTLLRAASVLAAKGFAVAGIRDVVAPERYKTILLEAYERLGDGTKWPSRATSIASYLHAAARDWAGLPADELAEVTRLRRMVKAAAPEMKQKCRDRVAQFDDDPRLLGRFFDLPYEMFAAADRLFGEGKPKRAAHLHQVALALAILQAKPLRRRNLAELEHGRHFVPGRSGRFSELRIPGGETKSGAHLQAAMPRRLSRRIERHVLVYRPLIEAVPCPYLFPGPAGKAVAARTLAGNITRLISRGVGVEFNVHLIRHLAATLLLDENEANLPVAQAVLGHADMKTTARFYAQQRTRGAQLKWMAAVEKRVAAGRRGTGGATFRPGKDTAGPPARGGA